MPRRRIYRRTTGKKKYSIEQTIINTPSTDDWGLVLGPDATVANSRQIDFPILPPTSLEGMRKVKHFNLSFTCSNDIGTPITYALVFVPEGYAPQDLQLPAQNNAVDLYPANQFVISQGVLDFSGGPLRISTRLSRNLNSGDSIHLVLATYDGVGAASVIAAVRYAITLQ